MRTLARLADIAIALALSLALANAPRAHAAEWPNVRESDTLWPGAPLDDPQWPDIPPSELAKIPAAPATVPASRPPGNPSNEPAQAPAGEATKSDARTMASDDALATGASLDVPPLMMPVKAPPFRWSEIIEQRFPSAFAFEGGARYWYSIGQNRFAFTNGIYPFGNPTSTLDWDRMNGHSGELFGRIDHQPTRLFVKGLIGGGILKGGDMDDLDFLADQTNFSNTTSAVSGNNLGYAMIDFGYAFEIPSEGIRYGVFVGYHYWHEKMTAYGVTCNADGVNNFFCGPAGSTQIPISTPVDIFDTTWNALRIGGDAKIRLYDRWTISGEIAFVPYARVTNDDSHLLRADLGPVPNIISQGRGIGAEAEAFVRYKVLPHFELGVGARYWGLFTNTGGVEFGPTFSPDFALTKFSTQRYGVLVEAKATF